MGPGAPFSPAGPTSPGDPCLPSCPGRPSAPGGPGGPGGPGSPGSPCYVPRVLRRYRFLPGESPREECLSVCRRFVLQTERGQERSIGEKCLVVNIQRGRQKKKKKREREREREKGEDGR